MNGASILNLAYTLTDTSATTFLDGSSTNIYAHLNTLYGHRVLDVLRVRVDKNASITNARTDLISTVGLSEGDNGYNGEYAFPSDLLRPVRIEVSYDGVTWTKCEIYDNAINTSSEFNETQINTDFSQQYPRVDFSRNSYKIRPTKDSAGNITNGIYIEYEKRQADFAADTTPSEIETNLHDILAYDLAELEFIQHADKHSVNQLTMFNKKRTEMEQRFFNHYAMKLGNKQSITYQFTNMS
jgi:hypothetical protein